MWAAIGEHCAILIGDIRMHKHLYVFRRPVTGEKMTQFKGSVRWR